MAGRIRPATKEAGKLLRKLHLCLPSRYAPLEWLRRDYQYCRLANAYINKEKEVAVPNYFNYFTNKIVIVL